MSNQPRRSESEVLPAITLDVEPTSEGLRLMSEQLELFLRDHDVPAPVGARLVSVANDVAFAVASALERPPVGRLQADADIGLDDTQLVLIAGDHRLPDVYAALRPHLDDAARQCDDFTAALAPNAELHVWARFRLNRAF